MRRLINAMSRNDRLTRNIIGTVILRGFSVVVGLATMPAYLRFFQDQSVLGAWFTVLSVFTWVTYFDFGVGNGLRTRVVKPLADKNESVVCRLVASAYAVSLVVGFTVFVLGATIVLVVDWNQVFKTGTSLVHPGQFDSVMLILMGGIALQLVLKNTLALFYALQRLVLANSLGVISALSLLTFLLSTQSGSLATDLLNLAIANVVVNTTPLALATVWLFRSNAVGKVPRVSDIDVASIKAVTGVGAMFLSIQLCLVVINSTDQVLISGLFAPAHVVEYQAYVKVFGLISMMFSLLTQPIWSAVAEAWACGEVAKIRRALRFMLQVAAVGSAFSFVVVLALPWMFPLWLGAGVVNVSYVTALTFTVLASTDMFIFAVTCIANGLGELNVQLIFTLAGALVKVPLSLLFVGISGHWASVVAAHSLAILPLVLAQAFTLRRRLAAT